MFKNDSKVAYHESHCANYCLFAPKPDENPFNVRVIIDDDNLCGDGDSAHDDMAMLGLGKESQNQDAISMASYGR